MKERTSVVNEFFINSLSNSSIVQMGDSKEITPFSRVLAIQREKQLFYSDELNFSDYAIFHQQQSITPLKDKLHKTTTNKQPYIKINKMKILAVSTSSIIHIGNSEQIRLETMVKNIRHLHSDT